jgi:hypothetical protein
MRITTGRALFCSAVVAAVTGCQTTLESPPTIIEITVTPPEVIVSNWSSPAVMYLRARIDPKGWAYFAPYLVYAPTNVVLEPPQATVVYPHCTREQGSATALRCIVNIAASASNYHFKWGLDYGLTASDTVTIEQPNPPGEFRIGVAGSGGSWGPGVGTQQPPPSNPGPLVLFDPPDGATCVGTFFPSQSSPGVTSVRLAWRGENTQENEALPGDYQVVVEHADLPNCSTAPGLDLSQQNAAYGYDPQYGCWVTRSNMNDTSPPLIEAARNYRWRVRRILANGQFEPFTATSSFTTAGPGCP